MIGVNAGGREFVFVLSGDASGIEGAGKKAQAALKGAADTTDGLDFAQRRATQGTDGLIGSLAKVGAGAFGLKKATDLAMGFASAMVEAQTNADRLSLQLSAGAGAAYAGKELEYVREVSNRLGLDLNTTASSYARFIAAARGTALEGSGVRQVFDSVAKSASVMGLNVDETQGALRALEQMMSKGVVQAEELRGQLGDRMPGALQIAARAMGVTTKRLSEMVQAGEVASAEFLPRFARQLETELGESADAASQKMSAATNRASNAWEQFKQTVAGAGPGDFIKGQLNIAADAINNVSESMNRAKESGGGFFSQLAAGTLAALQFANPLQAISYQAQSTAGQLEQAKKEVADLRRELETNPGNIYLRPAIAYAEELIEKLEKAKRATINLRAIDNEMIRNYDNDQAAAKARRLEELAKVTDGLTKKNEKLVNTIKVLTASYQANDLAESDYRRLVQEAYDQYLPKAAKGPRGPKAKPEPPVNQDVLDKYDGRSALKVAFEADAKVRDFMLDQVQKSDERQLVAAEKRLQQGVELAQQLVTGTESIYAQMLPNAEARGQALLAIERAQLTARLQALQLEAGQRQQIQDEIDRYMIAREAELTEELVPEWQRRLEAWQDINQLMRESHETLMLGIVDEGERAFNEWVSTGKLSAKNLVKFIGEEFGKLGYRKYLAPAVSEGSNYLLDLLGVALGSGISVDTSGAGTFSPAVAGRPRGGAATGTNYVERDMLTLIHKGEAVIPAKFNPYAPSGGGMAPQSAPNVMNVVYNVPPNQSPAAYAAALENNNRQLEAKFAADMTRPGRTLQRAAARARG